MQKKGDITSSSVLTEAPGPVLDENVPSKNVNRMQVVHPTNQSIVSGTPDGQDNQSRADISYSGNASSLNKSNLGTSQLGS